MRHTRPGAGPVARDFDRVEQALLNDYQHDLPLVSRPFLAIGQELGLAEEAVIAALQRFQDEGVVSRVGVTLRPGAVGAGTLAAMAVPEEDLERVAGLVSARPEVNHNYERENAINLWFVVTVEDEAALSRALADIERETGYRALDLRLVRDYHIDLGFELQWT